MEEVDKGCSMIRMGVSGQMIFLVPTHPGSPGKRAVKWLIVILSTLMLLNRRREPSKICEVMAPKFHKFTLRRTGVTCLTPKTRPGKIG